MRKHTRDTRTRSDVTKTVDDRSAELKEKTDVAGQHADDVATERETLEGVDLSGTQEAADALKDSLESAQEVSAREFTEEGESLEQVQREGEEFEQELRERSDATTGDVQKVSDAREQLHSQEASEELEKARQEAERDIEFLNEQEQRARDAREESRQAFDDHRSRVEQARKS
jgi:hypothetical protein